MSISFRPEASRSVVVLDGVDRVAFNEDGSLELLTPAANPTGNKVMTVSQMPFSKEYVSPEQTITAGGLISVAHGLGATPKLIQCSVVCKVADLGYSVGDVLLLSGGSDTAGTTAGIGLAVTPQATSVDIRIGNSGFASGLNKASGASGTVTPANWRLIVRAWA